LTVAPGVCVDVKTIVSWTIACESATASSVTMMVSGAPPELDEIVSQGAVAVAVQDSGAPSALARRSVSVTGTFEVA